MTFFTIVCLMLVWWGARLLATLAWREGEDIMAPKSADRHLEISHRLASMWGLPRWLWRNNIPVFGLKILSLTLLVLMAMPVPSVWACACTDIVVNGTGGASASIVDEYDGRFSIDQTDVDIPGITRIQINRQYNSLNGAFSIFGPGWALGWMICHLENTSGDIEVNFGDRIEYFHSADSYRNADNSLWLTFTGQNEVKVENRRGDKWYFNTTDKTLTKKVDKSGNQTNFSWNIIQKQIGVDEDQNPVYVDIYCPTAITYPDGRILSFTYSSVSGEEYLCTQVSSPDGKTVNYSYTQGLLTGIATSAGQTLSYNYHTDTNTYRTMGWLTNITYANAGEVNVTYNGEFNTGNALRVIQIAGPEGFSRSFSYTVEDGKDLNCNKCITTSVTDSLGHIMTYAKSDTGKTKRITDALGYYTQNSQDSGYRLTSSINKRGYWTTYGYANAGNSGVSILIQNLRTSMTNALGKVWTYGYDANGEQTSTTDALGHQINYTFDENRNVTSIQNGLGQVILTNTYDGSGFLSSIKDGSGSQINFSYNNYKYVTNVIDPGGKSWGASYNNSGLLTKSRDPLGHEIKISYNSANKIASMTNALGYVTSYSYDEMANLAQVVDANQKVTAYGYDKLQRMVTMTDALSNSTTLGYDSEGNLTDVTDALGHAYHNGYDSLNQVISWTFPGGGGESYSYDANGNLITSTNSANQVIAYSYDALDNNIGKIYVGTSNTIFNYSYDDANKLIASTKLIGSTTISSAEYSYDSANRLTSTVQNGKSINYEYDLGQRVSKIVYPSNAEARYEYNNQRRLLAIRDKYNNAIGSYTYDDAGRLIKRSLGNGLETVFEYDNANNLTKISVRDSSNTSNIRQSFEYGYDSVGNRIWVKYSDGSGDVYKYDDIYQVTGVKYGVSNPNLGFDSATGATRSVAYSYDAVGNRTSVTDNGNIATYSKNDLNQYTAISGSNFTYSNRGDLSNDGVWAYSYDYEGNLISASKSGTLIQYTFDAKGRRIAKNVNGVIRKFIYDGDNLIEERDGNDTVLAQYFYQNGIDQPIMAIIGNSTYYFHQDALGSISALSDQNGSIAETYAYDVYGKPVVKDGAGNIISASKTPFLFTGREYDFETGLYHFRYRAYSPNLGRFLQRDPLGFTAGDVNLYRYVKNNPIMYTDPLGLGWQPGGMGGGRVCNDTCKPISVLIDGSYRTLQPGECTSWWSDDVDGYWSDGNFYDVGANFGTEKASNPSHNPWGKDNGTGNPNSHGNGKSNSRSPSQRGSKTGNSRP